MKDTKLNLLRPHQVIDLKEELDRLKYDLKNKDIQNKGAVTARIRHIEWMLKMYAPEKVSGRDRDLLAARKRELEGEVRGSLQSQETMRKNPVRAVDNFRKGEGHPVMKAKILELKNISLQLAADDSDPSTWDNDAANYEHLRPEGVHQIRTEAQIPGHHALSDLSENGRETMDRVFPKDKKKKKPAEAVAAAQ